MEEYCNELILKKCHNCFKNKYKTDLVLFNSKEDLEKLIGKNYFSLYFYMICQALTNIWRKRIYF